MRPRRSSPRGGPQLATTPTEVLARTRRSPGSPPLAPAERAARTAAALAVAGAGWHWPWWLQRQLRPDHPAFVPRGEVAAVENLTGRSWRTLGTVGSGPLATVDPKGFVVPVGDQVGVDWAVGADDRWHHPAREAGVRQRLVGVAPVVETVCRVPDGEVIHRSWATNAGPEHGDVIVVEVANESPVPVAVALAVRPAGLLGAGSVATVAVEDATVVVDGRPLLALTRAPGVVALGDAGFDSLAEVVEGRASPEVPPPRTCELGLAQAAVVVPVPHRSAVRVVVLPWSGRRRSAPAPGALAGPEPVARGWDAHVGSAARLELPDGHLAEAWRAAVANLLVAAGGRTLVVAGREVGVEEATELVRGLDAVGLPEVAARHLALGCDDRELESWLRREAPSLGRNLAVFAAIADHWRWAGDGATLGALVVPVVKAAHWCERYRARNPGAVSPALAHDAHRELSRLAGVMAGIGQPEVAEDLAAFAARFVLDLDAPPPPGLTDDAYDEGPVLSAGGQDLLATARRAAARAAAGDARAAADLGWLCEAAGPVWSWPTVRHPRLGTGCGGSGDDPLVAAAVAGALRSIVVRETWTAGSGVSLDPGAAGEGLLLELVPVALPGWYGQGLEVHDLPTAAGRLSFAVRWHGARPALLWEVEPVPRGATGAGAGSAVPGELRLRAPGLDPSWQGQGHRGEALLAAPAAPAGPAGPPEQGVGPAGSFG